MMTYLTLSRSSRIAAAVIGSAPTDLFAELKRRPIMESLLERSVPGYAGNKEAALKARSAQCWPDKLCKTTPILLLQGSDDQNCVPRSALEMGLQLEQSGQPFRLIFFESGSHGLQEHTDEVNQQTLLWFGKYPLAKGDGRRPTQAITVTGVGGCSCAGRQSGKSVVAPISLGHRSLVILHQPCGEQMAGSCWTSGFAITVIRLATNRPVGTCWFHGMCTEMPV